MCSNSYIHREGLLVNLIDIHTCIHTLYNIHIQHAGIFDKKVARYFNMMLTCLLNLDDVSFCTLFQHQIVDPVP